MTLHEEISSAEKKRGEMLLRTLVIRPMSTVRVSEEAGTAKSSFSV